MEAMLCSMVPGCHLIGSWVSPRALLPLPDRVLASTGDVTVYEGIMEAKLCSMVPGCHLIGSWVSPRALLPLPEST